MACEALLQPPVGATSVHQHIPTNVSQGEEAQAADISAKQMHTVMSAKPRYNSKTERGCRGELPFLEWVKGSYCKQGGK